MTLADAENSYLQAEVDYRKALVDFERAQQASPQPAGVTVVSTAPLAAPTVGSGGGPGF